MGPLLGGPVKTPCFRARPYAPFPGAGAPVTFGIMTYTIDEFPHAVDFLTRELAYDFNFGRSIPLEQTEELERK